MKKPKVSVPMIRFLIEKHQIDLSQEKFKNIFSLLLTDAEESFLPHAEEFIKLGAPLIAPDEKYNSPLFFIADEYGKDPEVAELLHLMVRRFAKFAEDEKADDLPLEVKTYIESLQQEYTTEIPYSFETVLNLIKQARNDGKKVILVPYRLENHSFHEEKNGNTMFVSLHPKMTNETIKPYRPHLKMDINDKEAMKKLKGLFDKVIVLERAIIQSDNAPWTTFMELLTPCKKGELVIEGSKGGYITPNKDYTAQYIPYEGVYYVSQKDMSIPGRDEAFRTRENLLGTFHNKLRAGFEKLFDHVDLKHRQPFGYYWVLKGPKWKEEHKVDELVILAMGEPEEIWQQEKHRLF